MQIFHSVTFADARCELLDAQLKAAEAKSDEVELKNTELLASLEAANDAFGRPSPATERNVAAKKRPGNYGRLKLPAAKRERTADTSSDADADKADHDMHEDGRPSSGC